jgi:hypothetical protein
MCLCHKSGLYLFRLNGSATDGEERAQPTTDESAQLRRANTLYLFLPPPFLFCCIRVVERRAAQLLQHAGRLHKLLDHMQAEKTYHQGLRQVQ